MYKYHVYASRISRIFCEPHIKQVIVNLIKRVICSKFTLKFVELLCMYAWQEMIVSEFFSSKGECVTLQVR